MLLEQISKLEESARMPSFHPQVQKSIVRLLLLRDGISPANILNEIHDWPPTEQLFHLEFLILRISRRFNLAIEIEPQKNLILAGRACWVDFKLSLRDEVIPNLAPVIYFVELDGRGFHDRTRQEFTKERQRIRELQRQGARVYTFAGEEVFKNPAKCVLDTVTDLEREVMQRRHMITSVIAYA